MSSFGLALDVAIALVLMYLMLSLMVTLINEMIAQIFKTRAKQLKQILEQLFTGSGDDPLLRALVTNPIGIGLKQLIGSIRAIPSMESTGEKPGGKGIPTYLSAANFVQIVRAGVLKPAAAGADFLAAAQKIEGDSIAANLVRELATSVAKNADDLEKQLENWFNDLMDRATGVYKRWMQWVSLCVGLIVAIVFNADSIGVARQVADSDALRAAITKEAGDIVKKGQDAAGKLTYEELRAQLSVLPIGWDFRASPPDNADKGQDADKDKKDKGAKPWHKETGGWILKILGLLLTALALSLGAPFWFDILQKAMNLRAAGPKPKEKTT